MCYYKKGGVYGMKEELKNYLDELKKGNQIKMPEIKSGWTYKEFGLFNEVNETMIALRQQEYNMSEIGRLLGVSREWVRLQLPESMKGAIEKNLNEFLDFGVPDEILALKFNLSLHSILAYRKKNNIEKCKVSFLSRKRNNLVKYLFGNKYKTDKNFIKFFSIVGQLPEKQNEVLRDFYLYGQNQRGGYRRWYVMHAKERLKVRKINLEKLIEKQIIRRK